MAKHLDCSFGPVDRLNPSFGYQVKVTDSDTGAQLLFTSVDPNSGADLLSPADCLRVVGYYCAAEGAHDRNPATIDTYRIEYTGAPCGPKEYCIEAEGLTEQGAINYVRKTQSPANRERRIRSEQTGEIVEVYEGRELRVPVYGGEVGR